ncbi:helix-turn-helix domain-containing protein [Lachnospiraceae bacterium 46-15]
MISYQPFYDTLLKKGITEYALIFKHGIPANTLHRMKHGEAITTKTLDTLCEVLECSVSDILEYKSEDV